MRIVMFAHNVAWQGSALRALSLARPLARRGHDVTVVASRVSPGTTTIADDVDGVRLLQPPDLAPARLRNGGLSPVDLVGRLQLARRLAADVVHAFEPRPAATVPALALRRRLGVPLVADWADLWGAEGMAAIWPPLERETLGRLDETLQRRTRRAADAVTAISSSLVARAVALGVPATRVRLLPIGANADTFRPGDARAARLRLGIPADAPTVVHTGFAPFDDHLLTETWLHLSRAEPRAWMLTAGRRIDLLDRRAGESGSRARVLQLGTLPYPALGDVMAAGSLMVLPYSPNPHNQARFPNRVGDYLAAGRPVVTNPTGDLAGLVTAHGVGVLSPAEPREFAAAIASLLGDEPRMRAIGDRARALAEGDGSWSARADELEQLYGELVGDVGRSMSSS